jgi:carboxyl-terminal processing protease
MEKQEVPNARDEIKKLQEALKAEGEDPGSTDGIIEKKTRAALNAFQKANGLKASGKLDEPTAEKLGVQKPTQANTK